MDQETRAPPGRTGKRAPPYANGARKRAELVAAAFQVFAEKGYLACPSARLRRPWAPATLHFSIISAARKRYWRPCWYSVKNEKGRGAKSSSVRKGSWKPSPPPL